MKCIGYCERDKFAVKSYNAMYDTDGEWYSNDITKLKSADIPRADIWTAGSPCQNVSIAGGRTGIHGDRSGLFFKFADLLKGKKEEDKPRWVIVENVKGLLSSNKGFDFLEYLAELDEAGYDLEWQIFNSKDYGVPQNRERVYTIGRLRKYGGREILPIEGGNTAYLKQVIGGKQGHGIYETIGVSATLVGYNSNDGITGFKDVAGTLGASDYRGLNRNQTQNAVLENVSQQMFIDQSDTAPKITNEARTLIARYTSGMTNRKAANSAVMELKIKNGTKQGYDTAEVGDGINLSHPNAKDKRGRVGHGASQTLTAKSSHGAVVLNGREVRIRRLTPRECFRLQGFPDALFEKAQAVNSDTQLYKQAGNAVTVNVVYAIGEKIMRNLS